MPREHAGHSKNLVPTTKEITLYMDITRWSILIRLTTFFATEDGEILFIVSQNSSIQLLIAKFRLKLKKVGKSTRPFKYDLNQIPHDHTVEVMNRFKGFGVPEELWMEVCNTVQKMVTKTIPKKRNAIRQSGCLRKPYK